MGEIKNEQAKPEAKLFRSLWNEVDPNKLV